MRVSGTLRPIGSIINVSGILGHPPSRVMTTECAGRTSAARTVGLTQGEQPLGGRGSDTEIRTGPIRAYGSHLGCL